MKLATWNVNSIRARLPRVLAWLADRQPDVVCLQETKVEDAAFPVDELRAAGYEAAFHGQRTYNGVAILAREDPTDVTRGFADGVSDDHARFIVARAGGIRLASVYVPNGQAPGTDKYAFKLEWLARLRRWLDAHVDAREPFLLCGDFNVAPEDEDVHDPEAWREQILCSTPERAALAGVVAFGLDDLFRRLHAGPGLYTWWDYRQLGFPKNRGLRIDHVFATPVLAARCPAAMIDREARKGKEPSDHAPVIVTIGD